jgi:uncharacterized membrane protein
MSSLVQAAALGATGLFAGASLYISVVQVPATEEMSASGVDALVAWQRFFPKAASLQAPLAFTASATSLAHFLSGTDKVYTASGYLVDDGDARVSFLVGGLLMGSIIPYTLRAMMPLNRQLMLKDANSQPGEWKRAKLRLWGKLHHARTAASLAAFGLVLYQVLGPERVRD